MAFASKDKWALAEKFMTRGLGLGLRVNVLGLGLGYSLGLG